MRSSSEARLWIPRKLKSRSISPSVEPGGEAPPDPDSGEQETPPGDPTDVPSQEPSWIEIEISRMALTREYMARAARAAGSLVEEGRKLSGRLESRAEERGFEEGRREGLKRGAAEAEELKERAMDMVRQASRARQEAARQMKEELIQLAMTLARRVLNRELTLDPGAVAQMVEEALDLIPTGTEVLIRAHPAFIQAFKEQNLAGGDRGTYHFTYMQDEDLEPGDFVLDTTYGQLDGRLKTQLERLSGEMEEHIRIQEGES